MKDCPYRGSFVIGRLDGMVRIRVVSVVGGGPGVDRTFPVYRCFACGRSFDEIEAREAQAY